MHTEVLNGSSVREVDSWETQLGTKYLARFSSLEIGGGGAADLNVAPADKYEPSSQFPQKCLQRTIAGFLFKIT